MVHRAATSVHVDVPPQEAARALERSDLLRAVDPRLQGARLEGSGADLVAEAAGTRWHLRVLPEGQGCRIVIGEELRGARGLIQPGTEVSRLEDDAARLRSVLEAINLFRPGR